MLFVLMIVNSIPNDGSSSVLELVPSGDHSKQKLLTELDKHTGLFMFIY